jgi:DNA-binding Lrp family transcriptional regulator
MSDSACRPESNDDLQRRIVGTLQEGLPVVRHPYRQVATQLGITEESLLEQMRQMQETGAIRRIGAVPNHYAIGYRYNLMVVWDIDDNEVDAAGAAIGELDCVSHCYRRPRQTDWPYNLFAMVHGRTSDEVEQKIALVRSKVGAGYRDHTALKSTRILKKTGLRIRRGES